MYGLSEKICILFSESGVSGKKFFQLLDCFDGAEQLAKDFSNSQDAERILEGKYRDLVKAVSENKFDGYIAELERKDTVAVTWFSESYPESLRTIEDPPYILYCRGDVNLLKSECFAVIGTRKVSAYGRRLAKDFTSVLSEYFTIVSGLAFGVDGIAHETALSENGATIAVLGSGLFNVYPSANQSLADRIVSDKGLLVSEYGLYAKPNAYHFPQRNRIVAGLSKGLLVCQAPEKSGTNSTVELALEQGKDVFVVPGEIYDLGFKGSNTLIKTLQGACVTTPRDIVSFYGLDSDLKKKAAYQLSIDEQKVVNALTLGQQNFDELVSKTKMTPSELYFLLANLELESIIVKLPGNFYRLYGEI